MNRHMLWQEHIMTVDFKNIVEENTYDRSKRIQRTHSKLGDALS